MDEVKNYGQISEILEKGHKFEFEDGYQYELEEVDYTGEYDYDDIQKAIGDLQDEIGNIVDEKEYGKFCNDDQCLTLDSISLSAVDEKNTVTMDGIAMFVANLNDVPPIGIPPKKPYGIFVPYYNFSKAEVIFDAESDKLTNLDKKDLIEASKGIKDAINKLPYKDIKELMQRYTNKDNKEFSSEIVGMSSANKMSENIEKKYEAYSKVNSKINQRNQEKNIDEKE